MSRGRKSEAVARLFAAVYPPAQWTKTALETLRGLDLPPHRETPPAQVHLTLRFIGQRREPEIPSVVTSIERSCAGIGRFELSPFQCIGLPARSPRVIAVETDTPAPLLELHRRMVTRLARSPRSNAADRYVPHLTLGRTSGARDIESVCVDLPGFEVREVVLCRSVLKPSGAEHCVMARVGL